MISLVKLSSSLQFPPTAALTALISRSSLLGPQPNHCRIYSSSNLNLTQSKSSIPAQQRPLRRPLWHRSHATYHKRAKRKESLDPISTLVRPDLRVRVGSNNVKKFNEPLKHDDVVIVPELFGPESNWDIYNKLVSEIGECQRHPTHLISEGGSETFEMVIEKMCEYFSIWRNDSRLNWYTDSSDWKPFHRDSAAYNPERAKVQNISVSASFGACRELAFLKNSWPRTEDGCKIYVPQTNNGVFSFGRDVNVNWKHGINALAEDEQDGKGRISIVLWGLAENVIEELPR